MIADRVELSAQARADLDDLIEYLLERSLAPAIRSRADNLLSPSDEPLAYALAPRRSEGSHGLRRVGRSRFRLVERDD